VALIIEASLLKRLRSAFQQTYGEPTPAIPVCYLGSTSLAIADPWPISHER